MKLRTHTRDERGAVAVIAAAGLVLAMIAASLAVDLGTLAHEARQDQKVADLAALDAVRSLDDPSPDPVAAAVASAVRNEFECPDTDLSDDCGLTVQWSESVTGLFTDSSLTLPLATTVRVTAKSRHNNDFRFVSSTSRSVSRKASAALGNGNGCFYPTICEDMPGASETAISPLGTVRVGSSLATVTSTESIILNRLLTNTVGGSHTLNAVSWQGIANGNVELGRLRTALGFDAGTATTVLNSSITFRNLLDATVNALNADGSPSSLAAATPLATLASQVSATAGAQFTLGKLFNIVGNVGSGNDVADSAINVMDVVRAGLVLADTDHFAQFDLLASSNDLPALQTALPDFVSARVKFGLIEAPQEESGPEKDAMGTYRTIATTSQVRLLVTVTLRLDVVGVGVFNIDVPYYFDAASAEAKLDTLDCPSGAAIPTSVDILGVTQPVGVYIGSVLDGKLSDTSATPTPTVSTLTNVNVTSLIHVKIDTTSVASTSVPGQSALLTFSPPYDGATSQPVPGTALTSVPVFLSNGSQLKSVVTVGGLVDAGLSSSVTTAVINAVANANLPLVSHLYGRMARTLGLSIGGAEVWAPPVQTCDPTSFNTDPTSSVGPDTPYGYQIPSLVE